MPQPSKGIRRQVNVRLDPALVARIDVRRGPVSRDDWFARAAEVALRPTTVLVDPEIQQVVHTHTRGRPLRTEFQDGIRVRYYECTGCEMEVTE